VTSLAALQADDPQRVGPYLLLGRLGSGGMGRVYLARSPGGRQVAVKVIWPQLAEDAGFRARFAREVSAARKVGGLFTAQVVDADLDSPVPWLVTAYVPGTSLAEAVERRGPLPVATLLALAAGLAEGLNAIHAAGVIHRDLKPSNVMLAPDGPRIIDFGISSALDAPSLTGTGLMIGSPGFMSPEQAEGMPVGTSSDIFSLGGLLIFAGRGEGPFGSGDTAALLYRVVHGTPHLDQIPDKIRPLVSRCLSHDATLRPTAAEFLAELTAAYPSAADLTDWLPPGILELSARRGAGADPHPRHPSAVTDSAAADSAADGAAADSAADGAAADSAAVAFGAGSGVAQAAAASAEPAGSGAHAEPAEPAASPESVESAARAEPGAGALKPVGGAETVRPAAAAEAGAYAGLAAGGNASAPPQTAKSATPPPARSVPRGFQGAQGYQESTGYRGPPYLGPPGPQASQWYSPLVQSGPRQRRKRWPWAVGAAAACAVIIAAIVLSLGSSRSPASAQPGVGSQPSSAAPSATPTLGNLRVYQLRAGDCLTGANMELNTSDPWPELTLAVLCNRPHTAEVFFADNNFWPQNSPFPGDGRITEDGDTACNKAFRSYVGIAYSKSKYTWTNIIPDAATWPTGDRALHCVAYYSTPKHRAGATLTHSIRGSRK
jgi:eukaryotic-like serine/threonine-protein kinase